MTRRIDRFHESEIEPGPHCWKASALIAFLEVKIEYHSNFYLTQLMRKLVAKYCYGSGETAGQ